MKTSRKVQPRRRPTRRAAPLSLSARIERLEKAVLWPPAAVATGISTKARFTKLGADGKPTTGDHVAVLDALTGLVWAAEPLQGGKDLTHAEAMKACAELSLLGAKDWRAPTIQELLSIIDYERHNPAVDTAQFKGPYGWTWTSTLYKGASGYAWVVDLDAGGSGYGGQGGRLRCRAVRAGQQLGLLG